MSLGAPFLASLLAGGALGLWDRLLAAAEKAADKPAQQTAPASPPVTAAPPTPAQAGAGAAAPPGLPPLPEMDRIAWAKLKAGIVHTESSDEGGVAGSGRGLAVARCPPEAVWAVVTNHAHFADFMPRMVSVEVSRRTATGERALQTIDATLATVRYALDYVWDPTTLHVDYKLAEDVPHDVASVKGFWQLWPLDGGAHTLVEYRSQVDAGRWVPGPIRSYLQDRGLKDAVKAVVLRAESGGTWTKE